MARNPFKGISRLSRSERRIRIMENPHQGYDPSRVGKNRRKRADARARVPGTISWARMSHDAIGVKEAAALLGRGQTYVKTHAEELGGYQFEQRDLGHNLPGQTWRFSQNRLKSLVSA